MKYKITTLYYILATVVTVIPLPWWYYNAGDIIRVEDSPFQILITFLGDRLILSDVITFLLTGFRIYVFVILISYAVQAARGNPKIYSTMFWLPVLYLLDPVILYVLFNFILQLFDLPMNYPLFFFGTETISSNIKGEQVKIEFVMYPTYVYWLSLATALLYPFSRIEIKRRK